MSLHHGLTDLCDNHFTDCASENSTKLGQTLTRIETLTRQRHAKEPQQWRRQHSLNIVYAHTQLKIANQADCLVVSLQDWSSGTCKFPVAC